MSFEATRKYYDDQNFPHGFRRSGDFTRAQADILEAKGVTLKALHEGIQSPRTDDEKNFVLMCQDKRAATTPIEKAWRAYLKALGRKQVYFTASSAAVSDADADVDASDDTIEDDEE